MDDCGCRGRTRWVYRLTGTSDGEDREFRDLAGARTAQAAYGGVIQAATREPSDP